MFVLARTVVFLISNLSLKLISLLLPQPADLSASAPLSSCGKCGEHHATKSWKFAGKCAHCGILGHKEEVCLKKKAGKPKAMHLNADGYLSVLDSDLI